MNKLQNLGRELSKNEMKNVNGGVKYACTFTFADGTTWTGQGSSQCGADFICSGDDNCVDADCAGSPAC